MIDTWWSKFYSHTKKEVIPPLSHSLPSVDFSSIPLPRFLSIYDDGFTVHTLDGGGGRVEFTAVGRWCSPTILKLRPIIFFTLRNYVCDVDFAGVNAGEPLATPMKKAVYNQSGSDGGILVKKRWAADNQSSPAKRSFDSAAVAFRREAAADFV